MIEQDADVLLRKVLSKPYTLSNRYEIVSGYVNDLFLSFDKNEVFLVSKEVKSILNDLYEYKSYNYIYNNYSEESVSNTLKIISKCELILPIKIAVDRERCINFSDGSIASNVIFYYTDEGLADMVEYAALFSKLRVTSIELRISQPIAEKLICDIEQVLGSQSQIQSISIVFLKNTNSASAIDIDFVILNSSRIDNICFFEENTTDVKYIKKENRMISIHSKEGSIVEGQYDLLLSFSNVTDKAFVLSSHHNLYYHKKMIIKRGKAYVSESLKDTITDDVFSPEFYNNYIHPFSGVKKEIIKTCKDCEFRTICIDRRIPSYNKTDKVYMYDTECGYSPYVNNLQMES